MALIKNLKLNELKNINFEDGREIATIRQVFNEFSYCPKNFKYSCDIGSIEAGKRLIDLIADYSNYEQVIITDTHIDFLKELRDYDNYIELVHTIPYEITKINNQTLDFNLLHELNINVLNLKYDRSTETNFKTIVDNGFECYCWGVNGKARMKKILNLRYNDEHFKAIYTNYPDVLKKLRDQIYD